MATLTATTPITALRQVPDPAYQESPSSLPSLATISPPSSIPRGPVNAALNFYKAPSNGSAPYNYVEPPADGTPRLNFGTDERSVPLSDARGRESEFYLDKHAFGLVTGAHTDARVDWNNEEAIREHYYPEVEALLKSQCKPAARVLLFDHTVRRAAPNAHRAPVTRAHIDQTPKSAAQRVHFHLPAPEAEKLLRGRYRIINVWRSINGPVESFPLAFADSSSVADDDMIGVEHRYPDRTGETAGVRYNEGQKWWYWSGIGDEERILLQCFDSENPANRVPHSAFVDPRSGDGAKPRESIEVRALVFG